MLNTKFALMGMRRLALATATLAATQIGCGGTAAPADSAPQPAAQDGSGDSAGGGDVAVDDFNEPLNNYGTWIDDPKYGHIWQPADDVAGENFVPYTSDGYWAANEDGGWVFQSKYDTEWGWATYHYGRWVEHDDYGWVWIPGTEWAPSWVDFRYGGGNVGWAPMGPAGYVVPEEHWSFVEQTHFVDPGGVASFRFSPDRIHVAFSAAPLIEIGAGGGGGGGGGHHWSGGPSIATLKAAGVSVSAAVKLKPPARGAVKAMAKASVQKAASSNRPAKAAGAAPVKRASAASKGSAPGRTQPATTAKTEPPKESPKEKEAAGHKSGPVSAPPGAKSEPRSPAAGSTPAGAPKPAPAKKPEPPPPAKKAPSKKK